MSDAAPTGGERLATPAAPTDGPAALSLEEREAAALAELEWELSGPHTSAEIAERLGVSAQTVRNWTERALAKMRRARRLVALGGDLERTRPDTSALVVGRRR